MTVIHTPTELLANRSIYVNHFREGVFRPRLVEDRVIQSQIVELPVVMVLLSVTQLELVQLSGHTATSRVMQLGLI